MNRGPSALAGWANTTHKQKRALDVALDALRKIALGHPCDLPVNIARAAVANIKEITE